MKWEDVNKVIKWTLENGKHLDVSDIYLIEKATDDCHGYLMSLANSSQPGEIIETSDVPEVELKFEKMTPQSYKAAFGVIEGQYDDILMV